MLNWKQLLKELLVKLDIIKPEFTGKVTININQGGITDIEKTERLK